MIALILAAILLYLLWCRPYRKDMFSTGEYISLERTMMLNGIMIILVFLCHAVGYIPGLKYYNEVDAFLRLFRGKIGQLVVAGFFFYSGFGIMYSINRKGKTYLDSFPTQRFCKVLLHFDLAVLCYWLLSVLLGNPRSWEQVLVALTGYKSIGNSNWFICATLILYITTYLSFRWCGRFRWVALWVGCSLQIAVFYLTTPGRLWWDTLLCFPAGMVLAAAHEPIKRALSFTRIPIPLIGLTFMVLAFVCRHPSRFTIVTANLGAILFAYGTVLALASTAFKKSPRLLIWMGGALFSIYIFQRVPMILMKELTDWVKSPNIFIGLGFVATILIAIVTERFFKWLDKLMFSPKT